MKLATHPRKIRSSQIRSAEDGYILVWAIFLLTVFTMWLAVAIPITAKEIQRDRELETVERGKQYIRAVKLYYKRFHAFPPNQNALVNTNEIRFLRKKYIDPTTGKDDWKPILWGQAKTQTLGFFGQPLTGGVGGMMAGGIGPSGNGGMNQGSGMGSSNPSSSTFGPSSGLGGSSFAPSGSSFSGTGTGSSFSLNSSGTSGSSSGPSTGGTGTGSTGTSSDSGTNAQTFGGAGIIGFSPASPRQSILVYRKKNHYNEWEFIYDPMLDTMTVSGNTGMIGQPAGSQTNGSPGNNSSPASSQPTISSPSPTAPTSSPQQ